MAVIKHEAYGTIATVLSTDLNSLANDARALSAEIDNTTDLDLFDDMELVVTYGVAPSAGGTCEVYLLPSVDGTNFEDGSSSVAPPATSLVAVFPLRAVTTIQRVTARNIMVSPGKWKYLLINKAGQAMAASGNTLKRRPHSYESI